MYELNICYLYPDLLNLYGDRGNITALQRRCQWRNIEANVHHISIGDTLKYEDYDIFFIGGGQDFEQTIIQDDLRDGKREEIIEAVQAGKVFLGICGGFQLLENIIKLVVVKK